VYKWNFIERNRIVTGISDALLITEASLKSGTMHTARFALEQGKDVLAVPGNITSPASEGTNNLLKSGAAPVTSTADVLHALGLKPLADRPKTTAGTPEEQTILNLLEDNVTDGGQLLAQASLPADLFNQTLTMLEITGKVRSLGANQWTLY
jgi:DNA processing protein